MYKCTVCLYTLFQHTDVSKVTGVGCFFFNIVAEVWVDFENVFQILVCVFYTY